MLKSVHSDNFFFKNGICSLLGDCFIRNFFIITDFDNENILNECHINNGDKEIVGFVTSDLSYYKAEELGIKSILDADASVKDILDYFLHKKKKALYKPKWKIHLTPRERQFLLLIAGGMNLADISKTLKIKSKTVYSLRRNLMLKSGARNRIAFYNSLHLIQES